ncbi:hypothetical protein GCM10009741_29590 [Kribbella lupini]|uniref:Uncharacterized protein n=1 Tax=Kribbella lupini TaxID=291602 RepID=A0ABP4LKL1_9ACTN
MAPYLAAVRNYWSLLPAIAVAVVLILLYAVPTLINPQWTTTVLGLFQQHPEDADPAGRRMTPKRIRSRRMLAGLLVVVALALVGFNVSLNREANGCYQAAIAWGAVPRDPVGNQERTTDDPCVNMIYGSFIGDGSGEVFEDKQQPVLMYQLMGDKKPKYVKWVQNRPSYDDGDLLIGVGADCSLDLKVDEGEDKITAVIDMEQPCPVDDQISLTPIKLKKPIGDRKLVTVGGKELQQINPDLDSWPTVLKKLVTGG